MHSFGDVVMYFDVLYLNFNWFSGVNWVICPLFWSTPVPPRSISKVGNESRGNFGNFCKMDACQRKWSTQACKKYIPEVIRTLRIKQNTCLKYRNRCRNRCGYIVGPSHRRSISMLYTQWSVEMHFLKRGFCALIPLACLLQHFKRWIYSELIFKKTY